MKRAAWASWSLFLAVALGAFGAHGLKGRVAPELLSTWQTGVLYHLVHALGALVLGLWDKQEGAWPWRLMMAGTLFFSGNCYLYVLTGFRTFALAVPLGGALFLAAWALLGAKLWGVAKEH